MLQRFRNAAPWAEDSSISNPVDFEILAQNGCPPPATFVSETERFEWARLQVDAEMKLPSAVSSPEDMELDNQLQIREVRRARPRQERYVEHLLDTTRRGSMDENDLQRYEHFRRSLVKMLRRGLRQHVQDKEIAGPEGSPNFALLCIGSLRYGLALQSSEMDLLFTPRSLPSEVQHDIVNIAQGVLMAQGLTVVRTNTWDPSTAVLKVTSSDAYQDLVRRSMRHSRTQDMPFFDENLTADIFATSTSSTDHRCNIFFPTSSSELMEHSANVLQCYTLCDARVKKMGHFIKKWAVARNICCPRQGTLSGAGYFYLLIHYLRDVADPPILPNLHHPETGQEAKSIDIDGQSTTRYWGDISAIATARDEGHTTDNTESVPALLRGFFEYYCGKSPDTRCTRRKNYFCWIDHSVVLRDAGGRLTKAPSPSWEKMGNPETRTRRGGVLNNKYDPMRIQDAVDPRRNVAASVTFDGSQMMRDEFARARLYIEHATHIQGHGWGWKRRDGTVGEEFFERVLVPPPRRRPLV